MTATLENSSIPEEGNYYQILAIASTASLVEIRNAYEEQLEAVHLEAISAYSLFPEEQTEQKLLQIGQAFVTLANPIARAKYDDEIRLTIDSEQQTDFQQESAPISETPLTEKPAQIKTETAAPPHKDENKQPEEKLEIPKSVPTEVVGQTQEQRQEFYLNLAVKNEQTEESIEEYYSRLRAHGGNVSFNGAVLKQIRELKSITLDELAKITCIRSTYLEAIEEENFIKFTSEIYLKGYLICYIEAMNLPAEQIIEEYINLYRNQLEAEKG
jgi:curved DNA-binding protein CbpA